MQYYCLAQSQSEVNEDFQLEMTPAQRGQITLDMMPVFHIQDTKVSCQLCQNFLSQRVQDEICSYLKEEFWEMTFKQILTTAQFFYIPLCLCTFERVVFGYRIIKNQETFLEFASKSFRQLRLYSRLYPVTDREQYIEGNLKTILKFSLPLALLTTIQKKESLYHTFSSSELIDHYVSYSHTVAEGKLPEINGQYKVFRTKVGTTQGYSFNKMNTRILRQVSCATFVKNRVTLPRIVQTRRKLAMLKRKGNQ